MTPVGTDGPEPAPGSAIEVGECRPAPAGIATPQPPAADEASGPRQDPVESMGLAVAVWVCTLPFVFLLMVPWRGVRAAVVTALIILGGVIAVCWSVCGWERTHPGGGRGGEPR